MSLSRLSTVMWVILLNIIAAIITLSNTTPASLTTSTAITPDNNENDDEKSASEDTHSESSFLFTKSTYNVSIAENSPGKTYVAAEEKMGIFISDPALVVRYKIVGGDDEKLFKAETRHVGDFYFLLIRTRLGDVILNREYRVTYDLRIRATITSVRNDALRLKSRCQVFVNILDDNDLSPIFFPEKYQIDVPENILTDQEVTKVSAFDPDIGLNGQIYYMLAEESLFFAVHPTRGSIFATRPLQLRGHSPKQYRLTVLAKDRGYHHSREILDTSKAKVNINIVPVNKFAPKIILKNATFQRSQKYIYFKIEVIDEDEGKFGDICSVEIIGGNHSKLSSLTKVTSKEYNLNIHEQSALNVTNKFEKVNLTLRAVDCGGLFTTKSIVAPIDSAKSKSSFNLADHFYAEIHEISLVGTQVIKITISDVIKEDVNILYSITDGNSNDNFDISNNGVVFTTKLLDYELQNVYTLVIKAQDDLGNSKTTQLKIKIIDDNDNKPLFEVTKSPISVVFDENHQNGSLVYRILATDSDSGDNGRVSYTLANPSGSVPFVIDHSTGEIRTTKKLDYESGPHHYQILIRASDWGEPYRRQTQISLNFTLKDVNDHRPQFEKRNCTAYIPVTTKQMTEIMTLSAVDFDEASVVKYKMVSPTFEKCFSLNENTGILRLTCNLKEETKAGLNINQKIINVSATDGQHFADVMPIKIVLIEEASGLQNKGNVLVNCNNVVLSSKSTIFHRHLVHDSDSNQSDENIPFQNLNKPQFDPSTPKEIYLEENIEIGTKILKLTAKDDDHGFDGMLIWSLNSHAVKTLHGNKIVFNIDPFTGELFVIDTIDYEQHSKYKLHIIVCDLGAPQLCATHTLFIIIEDLNDNSPLVPNYEFNLPEDSEIGHVIGRLEATDSDSGNNAMVSYHLNDYNQDIFAIDPKNGSLFLRSSVDRETVDKYVLYVLVHDTGIPSLTSTSTVVVNVLDINDNAPQFYQNVYVSKVREDLPIGTVIMKMTAFDYDDGKAAQIHYSMNSDKFDIDSLVGVIRIKNELDFEKTQHYSLVITATDEGAPSLSSTATLIVEVEDINENFLAPKFPDFIVTASVKENSPVGTFVTNLTAFDEDSDLPVIFQIVSGDGMSRFRIDENGNILTTVVLDREMTSHFWITVEAKDRAAVPLSSFCQVYIEVLNENDAAPRTKEPFYYVNVLENSSIGSSLIHIEAFDPDEVDHQNNVIHFRIVNEVPFSIEQESGLIRTRGKLDAEIQSRFIIDVEVSETNVDEEVQMTLLSRTPIIVTVNDINEFEPHAIRSILRCQAYNSIDVNNYICQIVAFDRDATKCQLNYKIIEGNDQNLFRIDEGLVFVNKERIAKGEYELIVSIADCGTPNKTSQVRVIIKILQANTRKINHVPKIELPDGKISISEREEIGYAVALVKASDEDNDKLCFYIVSGNVNNTFAFQDGGALILARNLDFEVLDHYNLTIMVTDGINSSFANITINLMGVNDNLLYFTQDSYILDVLENATVGSELLHLNPSGLDTTDHLVFSIYSAHSQLSLKSFEMENSSGKLKLKESLDYETCKSHVMLIEVSDSRTLHSNDRAFVKVMIKVIDVNDEVPNFMSSSYEANILETASIGSSVIQLLALDNDSGINSQITYSIIAGNINNVFGINTEIGLIFLSKPLNSRQQSEYYLTVKATDKGSPPLSSTTNVHIVINIPDDVPPQFEQRFYKTNVKENEKTGKVLIALKAFSKQLLFYRITDGNESNKFGINFLNGEVWLKEKLDFETEKSYLLTITATNLVGLNDTAKLSISVADVNDVMPFWERNEFTGYILESAPVGSIILNEEKLPLVIKAYDGDSTNNAILIYSINEESARQYFDINSRTGVISLAKPLDYEKIREFNFSVSVTDIRPPGLKSAASAFVKIICLPVNDCPPVLSMNHYQTTLLLPTLKNVIVTQISASDCDAGTEEQQLEFSLKHKSLSENKFVINSSSGVILTTDEKISEGIYDMIVVVSDGIFTAEAKLTVTAQKIPKSLLRFTSDKFIGHIPENLSVPKKILVPAVEGSKLNEHLSFRILNPSQLFRIDKISGTITYNGISVDREEVSKFELLVEVQSIFMKTRVAHCLVEIFVDDVNDNLPIFVGLPYYFVFGFESQAGTQVGKVQAIDLDHGDNSQVTYSIVSGDSKYLFNINEETGQISLARTVNSVTDLAAYYLVVKASDSGFPSLEAQTNVTIKIVLGNQEQDSFLDLNSEIKPISFHGNSYARYGLVKSFGKISLRFRTQQLRSVILYQLGSKTTNILEIAGGFVQYRFDCGNGEGLIRVENLAVNEGRWHQVEMERRGNSVSITLDKKFRSNGFAPSASGDCPSSFQNEDLYFGGEVKPRPSLIGGEDINSGFIGCLDNILIDDSNLPLHVTLQSNVAILKVFANVEFNCNLKSELGACTSQPCLNGGVCHDFNNGSFQCVCLTSRFSGRLCETDTAPCLSQPCLNGGICFHDELLCKKGTKYCYRCECLPGYLGQNCQTIKYCSNNLCYNEGICEETSFGPKCKCQMGWQGPLCQYDIDECKFATPVCQPPATCINLLGGYRCICPVNSTSTTCTDTLYATNILSSPLNITLDEIIGILIALSILVLSGCIIACCWRCKNKSRRNRTPNNYRDVTEILLKNQTHNDVNLKRFSKISNFEMTNSAGINLQANRPTSYTENLNNFDTVRSYGSAADELELITRSDFIQNLKKNTSVSPTLNRVISTSPKHSEKQHSEKIQNDAKSTSCKLSSNNRTSLESDFNVLGEEQVNLSCNSNAAEGYHWDCSDWVMNGSTKPIANILEVSVNEIHDSESNSDNSQIELLVSDTREKNVNEDDESHERSTLLTLNDDLNEIEFVDKSEPTSPQKYLDMYLPRLTDQEWTTEQRRRNIAHYTIENDPSVVDDNLSVSVLNFNPDDNINVCEIDDDEMEADYNGEPKRESTFL